MKKLFLSFLIIISIALAKAEHIVLRVEGKVTFKSNDQPVKKGDIIEDFDQVAFTSTNDRVALYKPGSGRFTLTKEVAEINSLDEFMEFVKATVKERKKATFVGTRGTLVSPEQIKSYFRSTGNTTQPRLIVDQLQVEIRCAQYPMETGTFYVQYFYDDQIINKKLPLVGEKLVFDSTLYVVDQNSIPVSNAVDMKLMYISHGSSTPSEISRLKFTFTTWSILTEELQMLRQAYSDLPSKDFFYTEAYAYLLEFFGEPDIDQIRKKIKL